MPIIGIRSVSNGRGGEFVFADGVGSSGNNMIAVDNTPRTIGSMAAFALATANPVDPAHEITGAIDQVVEQTNLLALNAALAASRGGGQFYRMAAVVDAVRNMAERAARATKEIEAMVNEPQTADGRGQLLSHRASLALADVQEASEAVLTTLRQVAQMPETETELSDHDPADQTVQTKAGADKTVGGSK